MVEDNTPTGCPRVGQKRRVSEACLGHAERFIPCEDDRFTWRRLKGDAVSFGRDTAKRAWLEQGDHRAEAIP